MSYFYFLAVLFVVALGPVGFAKVKVDPILSKFKTPTPKRSVAYQLPKLDKEDLENPAKGLIIAFKTWPLSEKNKKAMLEKAQAHGLKEKANYSRFKLYVFEWKKGRKVSEAQKACESYLDFPYLDYCEPDLLQIPDNRQPPPTEIYLEPPQEVFLDDQTGNIKTCNIVSSQLNLEQWSGYYKSSDYWAQEMIGADLVREDLKLYPPIAKIPFVAVFDNLSNEHGNNVKNLISGRGHQAVLPDVKESIKIHHTASYGSTSLDVINKILTQGGNQCTNPPPINPVSVSTIDFSSRIIASNDPNQQCHASHLPSFINRSQTFPSNTESESFFSCH